MDRDTSDYLGNIMFDCCFSLKIFCCYFVCCEYSNNYEYEH